MDKLRSKFFRYVSQNILGMIGVSCYIIADTFFISISGGVNGITVLNLALPVYGVIYAIGSMIGVGSATRFAIARAQKRADGERYFSNAIFWIALLGIPFQLIGIFHPEWMIMLMGGDGEMIAAGSSYFRLFLIFAPFFMWNYVFSSFVRNDNSPTTAMLATVGGSLFNIVFDYIFVFPCGLGIAGAALATGISPIVGIVIASTHFAKKHNTIRFVPALPSVRMLLQSGQLGISAMVGELSSGVTTTVFNYLLIGLTGNIGVAAYGVIANFALVATAIYNGIAQGSQPLLSTAFGRGDKKSIRELLRLSLATAFLLTLLILAVVFGFTKEMIRLFNSEGSQELVRYALPGMRLYFSGYLFAGVNIVLTGYYSATNQPFASFVTSLSRGFAAIIAFSLLLSRIFGVNGVWSSFAAAEALTLLLVLLLNRKRGAYVKAS